MSKDKLEQEPKKKSSDEPQEGNMPPPEDFFKMKMDTDDEMRDFLQHMKKEKEQIELPEIDLPGPDEGEEAGDEPISEEDQGHLNNLNYTQEHKFWAELVLIQLDKGMATVASMVSGMDAKRYRQRTGPSKTAEDDYEVTLTAALINKYQVKFSMEFALAMLLVGKYSLVITKARKDAKEQKQKQAQQQARGNAAGRANNHSDRS
ncbi:hypothetical protein [Phaeodactylibacter xiamenensis]|uniref:hypothetical protein n=1 Tax=Phaeodactylibacter xiamenensis TaxID=1524460 RepID=UPI0024A8C9AB|nr:hypothetical protein [Phaeodactylibacter xiamenensis]